MLSLKDRFGGGGSSKGDLDLLVSKRIVIGDLGVGIPCSISPNSLATRAMPPLLPSRISIRWSET